MGIQAIWDMALPGQRRLPPCRGGPSALVLLTWRRMLGETSSWAPGCQIQISSLDFRPACPGVSSFMLIPGSARVKTSREQGSGAGKLRVGL